MDPVEDALNKLSKGADADAQALIATVRAKWRELSKRASALEMVVANEKMELFEDPLVIHVLHESKKA